MPEAWRRTNVALILKEIQKINSQKVQVHVDSLQTFFLNFILSIRIQKYKGERRQGGAKRKMKEGRVRGTKKKEGRLEQKKTRRESKRFLRFMKIT